MRRNKHSLSNYKLASLDMGQLVPVGLTECLPGDTIQQSTGLLLRFLALLAPVMHPVSVRVHHWFVPHRLNYEGFEDFITGGSDGLGSGDPFPTNLVEMVVAKGSLLDYLGVAPETYPIGTLSMLPMFAYTQIYNEFYRDQDLQAIADPTLNVLQKVAWEKDYFTTARPWTQKGPDVTIPIGDTAAIELSGLNTPGRLRNSGTGALHTPGAPQTLRVQTTGDLDEAAGGQDLFYDPSGTLQVDLSGATSASIVEFRRAFALQRYQEARAQYGSRYTEYLRYLGIRPSDARLQRPEYLGGGKQVVSFSEIIDTAGISGPVGTTRGHGIAAMRSNRFRYFCEEHGYIMTLLSLRPRSMYTQGLERHWSKRTKEEFYQKELELIGQQEIRNSELFFQGLAADALTFGYQDRYSEYRHQKSSIAGDFRDTLNHWHLARSFSALPVLNASFIESDPAARIFANAPATDTVLAMISHSIQARRLVGHKTIGRLI